MMEKRNFVTSVRTPGADASDIDEVLDSGAAMFGLRGQDKKASVMEKKAQAEDEKSDKDSRGS